MNVATELGFEDRISRTSVSNFTRTHVIWASAILILPMSRDSTKSLTHLKS